MWPTRERMQEEIDKGLIVFGADEKTIPSVRRNLFEKDEQVMRSVIFSYAQKASQDFAKIFDGKKVFDNPKSYHDIRRLIEYLTEPGDIVVDFFAGSGTTAHATLLSNSESALQRKFICVQLPEPIDKDDGPSVAARSMNFTTIAELCRGRIKRAIEMLNKENEGTLSFEGKVERGFRAFRLTESNFKIWDGSEEPTPEALQEQLQLFADHVLPDRSEQDILYELMLKAGLSLTAAIEEKTVADQKVYSIAEGLALYLPSQPHHARVPSRHGRARARTSHLP